MKVNIGCLVVRTDGGREGGRSVYGHVITTFSGMGRFTKLRGYAHARTSRARRSSAMNLYLANSPSVYTWCLYIYSSGLLIFRRKKSKFCGIFRGKFTEKPADFAGKKSKFVEKSTDFAGFSQEKVKICGKIGRLRGILAEKIHISKDFQGQILRKIGRFHGKF